MKIVYKKSISDRIREAAIEAKKEKQQIDYIELTKEEEKELNRAINTLDLIDFLTVKEYPNLTLWGVKIKVEGGSI